MNIQTGRPDSIEDAIIRMHRGSWFYWTDSKNKIYANLRLHDKVWNDGGTELIDNPVTELPTESEVNAKLAELQATYDEKNKEYKRQRVTGVGTTAGYSHISVQLDQLYHDMKDGKLGVAATTGSWYVGITSVKTDIPKPS